MPMSKVMKKWVEKLIEQFDFDLGNGKGATAPNMNEERATLLFLIDTFNKHLIDVDGHPVRQVRANLDEFAKELVSATDLERTLFRLRQYLASYRVDETAYFTKTFEDFRAIIWDFVDQLAEDISAEQKDDSEIRTNLDNLREAVESNSIDVLRNHSRRFIDCYVEKQSKKDKRRATRMKSIRKNLALVKQQLGEAHNSARVDHLTNAFNRKTFDEYVDQQFKLAGEQPLCLLMLDIDHFKKINDTYGHPIGDFVLKELVTTLKSLFTRDADLLARVGGEEFAILLPDYRAEHAMRKAEEVLARVRSETYVQGDQQIRFTVSIGVAQLMPGEDIAAWTKRADLALYNSKNTGRNKATLAPAPLHRVA